MLKRRSRFLTDVGDFLLLRIVRFEQNKNCGGGAACSFQPHESRDSTELQGPDRALPES